MKVRHIYTKKVYAAARNTGNMKFAATWLKRKDLILREESQKKNTG